MKILYKITALILIVVSSSLYLKAQTPIAICPDIASFTSMTRGYYFTAPTTFTICGIYVEDDRSTSAQSVEILRFTAGPPPAFSAVTNAFVSLFYQNNFVPNTMISTPNITINAGDVIGVYGSRATVNSYGNGPCATTIQGFPVTLYRSGMQFDLATQQMHDVWNENTYNIGRVTIYTDCCPAPPAIPAITGLTSVCEGDAVTYTVPAQAGAVAYNWTVPAGATITSGQNTTSINVTWNTAPGGQVCIDWTDACGTSPQTCLNVTVNPNPIPNITGALSFCSGFSTTLDAGAGYTNYNWLPSGISQTLNVTIGGIYSVTVTDVNGCTGTNNVTVIENPGLTPTITGTLDFCAGNSTTLDAGAGYTTYSWSPSGISQTLNVTTGGSYSVTVTDANGCTGTDNVTVIENPNPVPSITGTLDFCTGFSTTLDAGAGYITYSWTPAGISQTLNVTTGGNYSVIVTDANGCTGTDNVTVVENSSLTPTITGTLDFCAGNSTTIDAGAGYTVYNWSPVGSIQTVNVTTGGVYSVTVTDVNGCTGTDNVTVIENTNPTPSITGTLDFCTGFSTTLDAGAYTSWSWSNTDITQTTIITAGGSYTVTVTDANGCTGIDNTTVIENANPTPSITGTLDFCTGFNTTLDAGTGYTTYSWSPAGSFQTLNVTTGGSYTVTVTDANGCTGIDNTTVIENANPIPSITGTLDFCTGNSTTLDAGAGYTLYNWSPAGSSQILSVTSGGSYTVTVTDANGCTGIGNTTVIENPNPTPSITGVLSFCTGNSTTLDAGAYISCLWSTTDITPSITISSGGNYSVTVTDANGCTGTDNAIVTQNTITPPNITGTLAFCSGSNTTLDAGAGYILYSWLPGGNTQTINVASGGIYSVTVTDANGCIGSNNVTVIEIPNPDIDDIVDQIVCDTYTLPIITGTNLTGGQNFYSATNGSGSIVSSPITLTQTIYIYDKTGTTPSCYDEESFLVTVNHSSSTNVSILICNGDSVFVGGSWQTSSGTYYDNLLSVAGCDSLIITSLIIDNAVDVSITPIGPLCENEASITNSSLVNGGVWSGVGIVNSSTGLFNPDIAGPGIHEIIYTLNGACLSADTTYIHVDSIPTAGVSGDNTIMFGGNTILIGSGIGTYQWLASEDLSCYNCQYIEVFPSESIYYCLVVTDNNNGCKDTACIKVFVNIDCGELFIPNAFSPNGDGFNDVLYVRGKCIKTLHLSIYDRWGKLVFETENQNVGWDGRYKGRNMDDAVFLYYLQVTFLNLETEVLKGNISLIR